MKKEVAIITYEGIGPAIAITSNLITVLLLIINFFKSGRKDNELHVNEMNDIKHRIEVLEEKYKSVEHEVEISRSERRNHGEKLLLNDQSMAALHSRLDDMMGNWKRRR